MNDARIFSLGERAAVVDFGGAISLENNEKVLSLARFFRENPFPGLVECVPAYSSLTLFYDVALVRKNNPRRSTAQSAVEAFIENALSTAETFPAADGRLTRIPVCFDRDFAPDLESVAAEKNLTIEQVVEIFTAQIYRVFMLGFLPGFSYMGETDARLAVSRKETPRLRVEAGSVGLAGRQTGIYSVDSPGGWRIIGRTPLKTFNSAAAEITLLCAGDRVEFYPIGREEFRQMAGKES